MAFSLRPYQIDGKRGIYRAIRDGKRRILYCAATGTGKTELIGQMVSDLLSRQGQCLFVVDRLELCEQTADRFLNRFGFPSAVCQGQHPLSDPSAPVQVGTWQTLTRRREWLLSWIAAAPATILIVWDEAHEGMWTAFSTWLMEQTASNPRVIHVGLTATPSRTKRTEGMADVCDAIVPGIRPSEAMEQGYLVWDRYVDVPLEGVDLSAIKQRMGDYDETELGEAMAHPITVQTAINAYLTHCADRVGIAFAVNVRHAQAMDAAFRAAGIRSAVVHGETPKAEREEIMDALGTGRLQVLCNCAIAIKGLDKPIVSAILFSRPTKSEALWFQAIGRGFRLHEGKTDCIVLDQGECVKAHGRARDYPAYKLVKGLPPGAKPEDYDGEGNLIPGWTCKHCGFELNPKSQNACKQCGERRLVAKGRDFSVEYPEGDFVAPLGSKLENLPVRMHWIGTADSPFFFAGFKHPATATWFSICGQLPKDRPAVTAREWYRLTGVVREHRPGAGKKGPSTRLVEISIAPDTRFL